MTRIFFLSQLSPILELFPFDKITLKSHIFVLLLPSWASSVGSQAVLESGSWGHSVLQTPALVSWRFDNEIFSMVILSLPLIQEGLLSVSGERMCTMLVNALED